jgi:hypothetical protein
MVREWSGADFPNTDDAYYFGILAETKAPFPKYPNMT